MSEIEALIASIPLPLPHLPDPLPYMARILLALDLATNKSSSSLIRLYDGILDSGISEIHARISAIVLAASMLPEAPELIAGVLLIPTDGADAATDAKLVGAADAIEELLPPYIARILRALALATNKSSSSLIRLYDGMLDSGISAIDALIASIPLPLPHLPVPVAF